MLVSFSHKPACSTLSIWQVSLFALRVAVGTVSNVDLPLDDFLDALVRSSSKDLLDGMGNTVPVSGTPVAAPLHSESSGDGRRLPPEKLQKAAYAALCQFMQTVESPSSTCCGFRARCSTCGSTRDAGCVCVRWKAEMARVPNGKGGLVWVKKTNEAAYVEKIAREGKRSRNCPLS